MVIIFKKVFFSQGLNNPELILTNVTANYGEYWHSPSNKIVQLYSMAKAPIMKNLKALRENKKNGIK